MVSLSLPCNSLCEDLKSPEASSRREELGLFMRTLLSFCHFFAWIILKFLSKNTSTSFFLSSSLVQPFLFRHLFSSRSGPGLDSAPRCARNSEMVEFDSPTSNEQLWIFDETKSFRIDGFGKFRSPFLKGCEVWNCFGPKESRLVWMPSVEFQGTWVRFSWYSSELWIGALGGNFWRVEMTWTRQIHSNLWIRDGYL